MSKFRSPTDDPPVLAFLLILLTRWQRVAKTVLFAVCSVLPVLLYMVVQLAVTGQFSFTQRNSYVFYGRTAAAANCATLKLPPDERSLCPPPQVVATLGIDGLVGDPDGPAARSIDAARLFNEALEFYSHEMPVQMLRGPRTPWRRACAGYSGRSIPSSLCIFRRSWTTCSAAATRRGYSRYGCSSRSRASRLRSPPW